MEKDTREFTENYFLSKMLAVRSLFCFAGTHTVIP